MRTVFVSTGSRAQGDNYRVLPLARHAKALGLDVHIILPDLPENRDWFPEGHYDGVPIHLTASGSVRGLRDNYVLLRKLRPQFVHCVNVMIRSFPACLAYRATHKCELIMDFTEHLSRIKIFGSFRRAVFFIFEGLAKRHADRLVVVSRFLEQRYGGRRKKQVLYLPNAADLDIFVQQSSGWDELKRQWTGRKVITYFGTLTPQYDADLILDAAEKMLMRRDDIVFLFVGGGGMLEPYRERTKEAGLEGKVQFTGFVPDDAVPKYLCASDVFVFPIRDNSWNRARCPGKVYHYVAAMAPIVTNPVGEVREALGNEAWYFKDGDVDDLVRALEECLASEGSGPRPNHAMANRHSWRARAELYVRFLDGGRSGISELTGAPSGGHGSAC